jgi:phosphatidylserine/phosphatidylglycerophosphate/cardiolipin synthase-like enzyme
MIHMRLRRLSVLFSLILLTAVGCDSLVPYNSSPVVVTPLAPFVTDTPDGGIIDLPVQVGIGVKGPWYEIYFTDPFNPAAGLESGGLDRPLADAIDQARLTLDVAVYSLSLPSIRDALIRAYRRGVAVRVVMESDNLDWAAPQALVAAGIPVLGDRREGLMHDKFVVIDRLEVWTGSMNYTISGTYHDNNNLIHIRSTKVAEDYTKEFDEMFVDDHFGPDVVADTPNPRVVVDGTPMEIYFSPDDGVAAHLLELLGDAEQSIYFMAFSFTSDDLGKLMRKKFLAGLDIAGVMEAEQVRSNTGTEYDSLLQSGIDVRLDGNPGQMHHKIIVIDRKVVITGSYNFSASAETRNDENLIVIYSPTIAEQYLAEFQRVYAVSQPPE